MNTALIVVQSLNGETSAGSSSRDQIPPFTAQAHQQPVGAASDDLTLQPMNLLNDSAGGSRPSATLARDFGVPRPINRLPQPFSNRVGIVATLSMTAFIVILFLIMFPYIVVVGLANNRSVCVITAEMRLVMLTVVLVSYGMGVVLSPVVLVVFSADFRKGFFSLCDRAKRRIRLTGRGWGWLVAVGNFIAALRWLTGWNMGIPPWWYRQTFSERQRYGIRIPIVLSISIPLNLFITENVLKYLLEIIVSRKALL